MLWFLVRAEHGTRISHSIIRQQHVSKRSLAIIKAQGSPKHDGRDARPTGLQLSQNTLTPDVADASIFRSPEKRLDRL